jgi:hypothetical protein
MKRTLLAVVIASLFPVAPAAASSSNTFRGHTSQTCLPKQGCTAGKPTPFSFTASNGYVTSLTVADHSTPPGCFGARPHTLGQLRLSINHGTFSFHGPGPGAPPGFKIVVTGKISGKDATGTIVDMVRGCTSGQVTWNAAQV